MSALVQNSTDASPNKAAELEKHTFLLQQELADKDHRLEKAKEKIKTMKNKLEHTEARLIKSEDRFEALEVDMRRKVANLKTKLVERFTREQKIKSLVDTIKIAVQQGKIELAKSRLSRNTLLRARLTRLANMLEDVFGGLIFIAPLDVPENSVLQSAKKGGEPGKRFLTYIFSKTAREIAKTMGDSVPMLERTPIFQYVIDSRLPYIPDLKLVSLPANHFPLSSAMLVPIVVDGKSLGLAGFANGKYNPQEDSAILFESLANAWIAVISEAVKESNVASALVSNTLPQHVVERYMAFESEATSKRTDRGGYKEQGQLVIADSYRVATIIFCDIVGFTKTASGLSAEELVGFLNRYFTAIDEMVEDRGLEKIKTIGDCYMVASGIPSSAANHAEVAAEFALDLLETVADFQLGSTQIQVRIGMHSGPVVAGVIGKTKLTYDVWGDSVNKASRMESTGAPGKIQVSEETVRHLKDYPFYKLEPRGSVSVKGLGDLATFWLSRADEPADSEEKHQQQQQQQQDQKPKRQVLRPTDSFAKQNQLLLPLNKETSPNNKSARGESTSPRSPNASGNKKPSPETTPQLLPRLKNKLQT